MLLFVSQIQYSRTYRFEYKEIVIPTDLKASLMLSLENLSSFVSSEEKAWVIYVTAV